MMTLKIMSAGAVEGLVRMLAPDFTRACGHELDLNFDTVGALRDRFVAGESADVIILSVPAIQALESENRVLAGSRTDLGRAAVGIAVRDGMLMPDISTVKAFRRALLHANSIAANDPAHGGSSGIYLAGLLDKMGMADAIRPKLVLGRTGREVAHLVASGKAELGITFTSEFVPIEGTRVVGPFPKEIGFLNGYAAALPAEAGSDVARSFLEFLTRPDSRACFKAFGLE
jgi:molybdate transport system substrate-binding protein